MANARGLNLIVDRVTATLETIDPVTARAWLQANTSNRPIKQGRVDALIGAIKRNEWQVDGETIKFSKNGRLLDGQHRLKAIDEAGVSCASLVVRGLDEDVQLTIDTGAKRTFAEHLSLIGKSNYLVLAAVTHAMWKWENHIFQSKIRVHERPTFPQLLDVMERHQDLEMCAQAAVADNQRANRVRLQPSVRGLVRKLFTNIHAEDADRFFASLATGTNLSPTDPIYRLRELLIQNERSKIKYPADHLLALTIKAWNAYRLGREVRQLHYRPGGMAPEEFPIPV